MGKDNIFNYKINTTVSGCPTSANLKYIFGENWKTSKYTYETLDKKGQTKNHKIDFNDLWHVLFTFDTVEKLKEFALEKLNLDEINANRFSKIILKKDYAALSLKAIKKILPFLENGLIYSHAVFVANLEQIVDKEIWDKPERRDDLLDKIKTQIDQHTFENNIAQVINGLIKTFRDKNERHTPLAEERYKVKLNLALKEFFGTQRWKEIEKGKNVFEGTFQLFLQNYRRKNGEGEFVVIKRIDEKVTDLLLGKNETGEVFCSDESRMKKLYHPSDIAMFKPQKIKDKNGVEVDGLGSPATPSVRNPMAMRSLFQLRKLVNTLITEGKVDRFTKVNIELARELNDSNKRIAIKRWQKVLEEERVDSVERIKEYYFAETGQEVEPTEDDILKYKFWKEQKHKCLYTGVENISISDFIGTGAKYEIEHTLPRSQSEDNSQMNKTLCDIDFNRMVKKNQLPSQLSNYDEILLRADHWKKEYEDLDREISRITRSVKAATTKEQKDRKIQQRHLLSFKRDYIKGKYDRLTTREIKPGFKNSQKVDIGIISKYARAYLGSYFAKVYSVKGEMTSEYRKAWGLQESYKDDYDNKFYKPKDRSNHVHHCIDAIVIAAMDKQKYDALAHAWASEEESKFHNANKKKYQSAKEILLKTKPWTTFTQDVKSISDEIFVVHNTPDKVKIQSKKKLRKRGVVQRNSKGEVIYQQGDTVRGSLHQDTFYGAIAQDINGQIERNSEGEIIPKYVVRKELNTLKVSDVEKIVDPEIRKIIQKAIEDKMIKKISGGLKVEKDVFIWQNKEKGIPLKKVRVYTPAVKNPLPNFKKHRDLSKQKYKQKFNVVNDENYCMAIYEGGNKNGKTIREFELVNMLQAGRYYRLKSRQSQDENLLIPIEKNGKKLKYVLKKGTLVLFYEKSVDDFWGLRKSEKVKRLYNIIGFEGDGRIQFRYHQTALQQSSKNKDELTIVKYMKDNKLKNSEINFINPLPWLRLTKGNFNFLVENYDFNISVTGNILKR